MLHLLFLVISYGSMLLFIMDSNLASVAPTALMFIVGTGLIIYRKIYKVSFWKSKHYFLIPVSILITGYLGPLFYNRWIDSQKIITVASIIHIPINTLLLLGAIVLSVLSVYFIYAGLVMIHDKLSEAKQNSDFRSIISPCIAAAFATVFLVQFMIHIDLFSIGYFKLAVGALIVFVAILFLYCLSGKVILSIFLGASIFMVISTIGVYLYSFRGRLFEPVIFSPPAPQ